MRLRETLNRGSHEGDDPINCRAKSSRVGKSSTAHAAEIFARILMMPQERGDMRSEKLPCARAT